MFKMDWQKLIVSNGKAVLQHARPETPPSVFRKNIKFAEL